GAAARTGRVRRLGGRARGKVQRRVLAVGRERDRSGEQAAENGRADRAKEGGEAMHQYRGTLAWIGLRPGIGGTPLSLERRATSGPHPIRDPPTGGPLRRGGGPGWGGRRGGRAP